MLAWDQWVSRRCCPGLCSDGLPDVCSAFCAPMFTRWWRACETSLQMSPIFINTTDIKQLIAIAEGMADEVPFLDPLVHSQLGEFYDKCDRTVTPMSMHTVMSDALRSTVGTANEVTHKFRHAKRFDPIQKKPALIPVSFEFTNNGQLLTSDGLEFTYYDQAEVYSIFPYIGPDTGRTKIQVNGSNFVDGPGLTCQFGSRFTKAIYQSPTLIYCITPKPAEGGLQETSVRVANNRQQYTEPVSGRKLFFDYYTLPNITRVEPTAGPQRGGTLVYIDGNHFIAATLNTQTSITCRFGNMVVAATLITDKLITCLAPKHEPGTFKFSISLNDQQYTTLKFWFTFYGISRIYPPLGPLAGLTDVMITGRGFATGDVDFSLQPRCRFGEDFVDAIVLNSTNMYCVSPASTETVVRRFDISFSGDQWTRSGANFSYYPPASVTRLEPFYDGKGLGPASGGSRVTLTGENFIDVPYLRCRFGHGMEEQIDVTGFFISNTSMYCMSPPVYVEGDTIYLVEMSYNDQQYTGAMTNTKLPYLYYPPFIMSTRAPMNAPFGGGNSLGSFHENAKRAVIYTPGAFDYTLVTITGENFKDGDLTFCRWKKAYTADQVIMLDAHLLKRTAERDAKIEAHAAAVAEELPQADELFAEIPPMPNFIAKCDKYGCYNVEETTGCTCNENVDEENLESVVENVYQVSCDSDLAPDSCAEPENRREWAKREGCYLTHTGKVPFCPTDNSERCCFSELTISAVFESTTEMKCKPVDFPAPSGTRWSPNNVAIPIGDRENYGEVHGQYINAPFVYDFDVTRNGQDYSGSGMRFIVYGERFVTYIEPGSGPAEGGLVTSLYGEHFIDSENIQIRFGAYTPPGAEVPGCKYADPSFTCLNGAMLPCYGEDPSCVDGPEAFRLVNTSTLADQWAKRGVPPQNVPENVWEVYYDSDVKITTINPYHGQTAKVDVVLTSNKQQYERSDLLYSYSSSSAAMTEVTGATDGVVAGNWATFRIEAREANGAPKIEGGDVFVVKLEHQHPNYRPPLCMHCVGQVSCACPLVLHSGLTGQIEEDADIIIDNPYSNGLYIVTYMTTIAGRYEIAIELANQHVPGSPFTVQIKFDQITTETTYVYGPGLDEVKAGYSGDLYIQARDQFHNNRTIGRDMPSFCVDITHFESLDDGTCSFCHPCPFPDEQNIYWGRHSDYPGNMLQDGSVVYEPMRDECVMLFDEQIDDIIEKGKNTACELADCGIICDNFDGTYVVQWTAIKAKGYTIRVARGGSRNPGEGAPVPNSPFPAKIVAGDTSVFGCISSGQGRFNGVAGTPEPIFIRTSDLYGNKKTYGGDVFPWELTRVQNGVTYRITDTTTDNEDGTYMFTYVANVAATYTLSVKLIAQQYPDPGEFIVDSPWFNVHIVPAPAAATHCVASGDNMHRALSGYSSSFWVTAFDMFDNGRTEGGDTITVMLVDGPELVPDCKDAPGTEPACVSVMDMEYGTYMVAYQANIAGAYNLSVTLTEVDTKGVSSVTQIGGAYCGGPGQACCPPLPEGANIAWSDYCTKRGDTPLPAPFYLRIVPEAPTLLSISPRSGPVTGDTLVSVALQFATTEGPRSRPDFERWMTYLGRCFAHCSTPVSTRSEIR